MANDFNIGPKLTVDGEAEFKKAISGINSDMTVLGSEMKKVTAQFAKNKDSVEALTAENAVYNKQIDEQKKKLGTINDALESAKKEYGANSKEVKNWQIQLNNAQAKLYGMEQKVESNEQAIKDQASAARDGKKAIDAHAGATEKADKKTSGWSAALKSTGAALGKGIGATAKGAAVAVGVVATAAGVAGKAMWGAAKDTGTWADDLLTLSAQTGVSAKTLQEFQYASRFVDVEVETMTGSMAKLIKSMAGGTDKTKGTGEAFAKLGVKVTDSKGKLRDNQTVWMETIDALGKVKNETQRDALAMQIFGKSAQDLNPLIKAGSGELKKLGEEAAKAGLILSDDMVGQMGKFDDIMQKTDAQMDGLKKQLVVNFMPALQGVGQGLSGVLTDIGGALKDGFQPEDIKKIGASLTGKLIEGMKTFSKYIPDIVKTISSALTEVIKLLVTMLPILLPPLMEGAMQLMQGLLDAIMKNIDPIMAMVTSMIMMLADFIIKNLPTIIEAAIKIIVAVATGIAEALPDLIPKIVEMIVLITKVIMDNLPLIISAAIQIIMAVISGLIGAIPDLIGAIPEIIDSMVKAFTDFDWAGMGKNILDGIGKGITNFAGNLADSMTGALGKAVDSAKKFLGIASPSKLFEKEIGLNMGLGIADGLDKASGTINDTFKSIIPTDLDSQYNIGTTGTAKVQHVHSGTLTIKGVNDKGQFMGAVDMILDQLRMEKMLVGA